MNEDGAALDAARLADMAFLETLRAEAVQAQESVLDQLAFAGIDRWTSAAAQVQMPALDGALSEALAQANRAAGTGALAQVADAIAGAHAAAGAHRVDVLMAWQESDAAAAASSLARSLSDLAAQGLALDVDRLAGPAFEVPLQGLVEQVSEGLAAAADGMRGALAELPFSAGLYDVPPLPPMTEVKVETLRSPAHRHTELLTDLVQSQGEMVQSQAQMVEAQRVMIARQDEELAHHRQQAEESRRREVDQQAELQRQHERADAQDARADAQDARATRANLIALGSFLVAVLAILQAGGAGGALLGWVWSDRTRALLVDLLTWWLTSGR